MLWMITDFSRYSGRDDATDHISMCLRSGADKVSLRNQMIFPKRIVYEIKESLDRSFPQKEIFIHDPDDQETNNYDHLHFSSRKIDDAMILKKAHPEKTIALSTHSENEYEKAFENGIDYAFLSPVFKPLSKPDDIRDTVLPIVMKNLYLLGGIDKMKALLLIEKGFYDFAGISLFYGETATDDIRELKQKIREKKL